MYSCVSLPDLTDENFYDLMISEGVNPCMNDPFKWANRVWWDQWFPEVLKECRKGLKVILKVSSLYNVSFSC